MTPRTKKSDIDQLHWAITEASAWRGAIHSSEERNRFDDHIQRAFTALDVIRTDLRTLRRIKTAA